MTRIGGGLGIAAVAGALALSAAPALAADSAVMSDFRRFCVATGGDAAKVKALAVQAGWTEVPASAFAEDDADDVQVDTAFMSTDGGLKMLAVMRGEVQPGISGKGCVIAVEPDKATGLEAEAAALARVKQHKGIADNGTVFIYSDTASGRRDLSGQTEEQIIELSKTAPVQGVFVSEQDEMTMIALVDIGAE